MEKELTPSVYQERVYQITALEIHILDRMALSADCAYSKVAQKEGPQTQIWGIGCIWLY